MKKILLKSCIYHTTVSDHKSIKDKILFEIDRDDNNQVLSVNDKYIKDKISKLDWHISSIPDRPWVVEFYPFFNEALEEFIDNTPYTCADLNNMWYQQYEMYDNHGWHIHGDQFTGVYYLEFPTGSSKTELLNSFDNTIISVDVEEGDIIFFPSHIVHRGPKNNTHRKTIISFNFSIGVNEKDDSVDFKFMETV